MTKGKHQNELPKSKLKHETSFLDMVSTQINEHNLEKIEESVEDDLDE